MKPKKLLSLLLILCMLASFIPAAFAEGEAADSTEPVSAVATIYDDGDPETVEETTVEVSVGNVTVTTDNGEAGVTSAAFGEGVSATVTVSGDVTVTGEGSHAVGVEEFVADGGTADVTVGGDVSVTGDAGRSAGNVAVDAVIYDDGTATVAVSGDVTSEGNFADGVVAVASLTDEAAGDATVAVEVAGDVTVTGTGDGVVTGVYASAFGENRSAAVQVDGSVTAAGSNATGAVVSAESSGTVTLEVAGDLTGDTCGLALTGRGTEASEKGTIDVVVEGTLSGGESAVLVAVPGVEEAATLTVWKAEVKNDHVVAAAEAYSEDPEEAEAAKALLEETAKKVEENLLYIIKLEQPGAEQGSVTLAGVVDSHGFDAAKEGDTVTLKSLVKEGYQLVGAFNGTENKTSLMKDANGDYYIVVPKGGGVYLTVKMEKVEAPAEDSSSSSSGGGTDAGAYVPVPAVVAGKVTVETSAVETTQGYDVEVSDSETVAELEKALLTKEEQQEVAQGKDVSIVVEYKPATVSAADQKKVQDEVGSATIATWLNVSVFKQIGNGEKVKVENPSTKIKLQIVAPDDIIAMAKDGTPFEVVGIVNGKVVRIPAVYNAKTNTIDFETDFFGEFALVYG